MILMPGLGFTPVGFMSLQLTLPNDCAITQEGDRLGRGKVKLHVSVDEFHFEQVCLRDITTGIYYNVRLKVLFLRL
jgi:hypothetical protein